MGPKTFGKLKSRGNVERRESSRECMREGQKAGVRKMKCEKCYTIPGSAVFIKLHQQLFGA